MDDNVWEYPFGDLYDDTDLIFHRPEIDDRSLNQASTLLIKSIITSASRFDPLLLF